MGKLAKPANRLLFALCVLITGAIAGAFVWAFFFCMDIGLGLLWEKLPQMLGAAVGREVPALASGPFGFTAWPLIVCLIGGLAIGLYDKHVGFAPEELNVVMGKVKGEGRYPYDHLGKRSLSALLPLLFGGSVGPEAGLTGVIAGLCTWVGDRMRRFGADFRAMTVAGTQAALTALFTAPLYGFAAPLAGTADGRVPEGEVDIKLPRAGKAAVYLCAVLGALGAFFWLAELIGGGGGLPRFSAANVGPRELAWLVPLALAGTACGWAYHASGAPYGRPSRRQGDAGRLGLGALRHGASLRHVRRRNAVHPAHGALDRHPGGRVGGDGLREGGAHARVHQAWLARRPFLPGHLLGDRAWLRLCPDQRRRCGVLRCHVHLGAHGRGHAPAAHGGASAGHVLPA